MVLGFERINVRRRSPNPLINFITPLKGTDEAIAQDYLERIAAIVYPVMRDNNLAVMTLEEFPANREFWGRNFNGGEVIQLVLKHPFTGQWLPFRFVEGTMLHELAHNKEMNHSRFFWRHKNAFSATMVTLHARNYTGEGFWSAGRTLTSAPFTTAPAFDLTDPNLPPQICGGTYRSQNRQNRHKKPPLTAKQRQEQKRRRIEKRFGSVEGIKLGVDEQARLKLKDGKKGKATKTMAAPRVAGSKRGRELRAAAALKRFEQQARETKIPKKDEDTTSDEDESEEDVVDVGGGKMLVEVSKKEDGDEEKREMGEEMKELAGLMAGKSVEKKPPSAQNTKPKSPPTSIPPVTTPKDHKKAPTTARPPTSNGSSPTARRTVVIDISDTDEEEPLWDKDTKPSTSTGVPRQVIHID
ncbi:WLM-domain-containing protein [Ascodesmis nigricans]|uniref:WLM-domain-containing protein n=1 Tax=Ascodesmis nigricans TaxID=341454 RepID=A0A4S2N3H0_9PEZI|nr:WLM-domain-containing protein [Ascodesmis nigricans]